MCRLYGYLSDRPTRVECGLIRAQNSLLVQSGRDRRGVANADGWGLAHLDEEETPRVQRGIVSATCDRQFQAAAQAIYTRALVGSELMRVPV